MIMIIRKVIITMLIIRCKSVPVSVCGSGCVTRFFIFGFFITSLSAQINILCKCVTREGEEECQDTQVFDYDHHHHIDNDDDDDDDDD